MAHDISKPRSLIPIHHPYHLEVLLIPKRHMEFFEFRLGSHFLSLQPNFAIFRIGDLSEIYSNMNYFFKIICRFGDINV